MAKFDWDKANKQQSIKRYGYEPAFVGETRSESGNYSSSKKISVLSAATKKQKRKPLSPKIKREQKKEPPKSDVINGMLRRLIYLELNLDTVSYKGNFAKQFPIFVEMYPSPFAWAKKQKDYKEFHNAAIKRLQKKRGEIAVGPQEHVVNFSRIASKRWSPASKLSIKPNKTVEPKMYWVKKEDLPLSVIKQGKRYKTQERKRKAQERRLSKKMKRTRK